MIDKERALRDTLSSLGSIVVAYSGGVDSAYLAWVANDTLGDRSIAITADSPSYPRRHREMAIDIAGRFGIHDEFIRNCDLDLYMTFDNFRPGRPARAQGLAAGQHEGAVP